MSLMSPIVSVRKIEYSSLGAVNKAVERFLTRFFVTLGFREQLNRTIMRDASSVAATSKHNRVYRYGIFPKGRFI